MHVIGLREVQFFNISEVADQSLQRYICAKVWKEGSQHHTATVGKGSYMQKMLEKQRMYRKWRIFLKISKQFNLSGQTRDSWTTLLNINTVIDRPGINTQYKESRGCGAQTPSPTWCPKTSQIGQIIAAIGHVSPKNGGPANPTGDPALFSSADRPKLHELVDVLRVYFPDLHLYQCLLIVL